MKKIFPIIIILASLMTQACGELAQVAVGVASAVGGGYVADLYERYGYSQEDAAKNATFVVESFRGNTAEAQRGIAYVQANDEYLRQNIVSDAVFDHAGTLTGEQDIMNTFKGITGSQITYRGDVAKATTDAERQAAFDRRSQTLYDVGCDAYDAVQTSRAQKLAERLAEEEEWLNSRNALDAAGTLIAIEDADYLTEEEKQTYISEIVPNKPVTAVRAMIKDPTSGQSSVGSVASQPSAAEIAAQREAEARARAKAEKDAAISTVKSALLDSYKFDSTELSDEQKATLDRIAVVLNQYPDLNLQIKGHTCDIGTNSVNERVGLRRAETAKSYLIDKGIAANRISTVSGGENEPVVENNSADNRKQNRRLTFEIN